MRALLIIGALALATPAAGKAAVAPVVTTAAEPLRELLRQPPRPWRADDPADSLYRAAREALNRNDFRQAATLFAQIPDRYPKSAYAADALYWRAYALYRQGGTDELRTALRALDDQRGRYPSAATRSDADALAVRIRGTLARQGDATAAEAVTREAQQQASDCSANAEGDNEDDVRTAALNALLQMDAERAVPIIQKVLARRDACSVPLRRKALFLLAQKRTPETENMFLDVVRNDPSRSVREQAVFWLGQVNSERATAALEEIATRGTDEGMREKAVFSLAQQGGERGQAIVRQLAERSDTPRKLREQAVFWIGQRSSAENRDFLRTLFTRLGKDTASVALQRKILFSLSQMRDAGNDRWLLGVALDASQPIETRKQALWTAGQAGVATAELSSLYDRLTDRALKEQLIWVLTQSDNRAAATDKLIDIAKHDRDPDMRKKAIFWLGQSNDPRVQQLLLDIINQK